MNKFYLFALGLLASSNAFAIEEAVFEQPDGDLRTYHGFSHSIYREPDWGFKIEEDHDGLARKVVFADNGDVWFKDPITYMVGGQWIKGHLEDGVITVSTPILFRPKPDSTIDDVFLTRFVKGIGYNDEGEEIEKWVPDTEKDYIQYIYTEDDRIIQVDEGKPVVLGLMIDDSFCEYGDWGVEYTRVSHTPAKFPTDVEPETWSFKGFKKGEFATQMQVAIDGETIYIKGFWDDFPETTWVGNIDGDKVSFPSNQYMGFMTTGTGCDYYVYIMTGELVPDKFPYEYVTTGESFEFAYDKEAKTLTALSEDLTMIVKKGQTIGSITDSPYVCFSKINMNYIDHIAPLSDIKIKTVFVERQYGWGYISFDLYPYDSENNGLNQRELSYSLFLDGEVYVFDKEDAIYPEAYEGIDEPTTEIPYLFDNGYGIDSTGSFTDRTVMFYQIGFEEIGVQAHYNDNLSGKRISSNITHYNVNTGQTRVEDVNVGVENIFDGNAEIESVNYYNVSGQPVDASYKGIVIEVARYANGEKKVTKKVLN